MFGIRGNLSQIFQQKKGFTNCLMSKLALNYVTKFSSTVSTIGLANAENYCLHFDDDPICVLLASDRIWSCCSHVESKMGGGVIFCMK
jgi:hypothetical protein